MAGNCLPLTLRASVAALAESTSTCYNGEKQPPAKIIMHSRKQASDDSHVYDDAVDASSGACLPSKHVFSFVWPDTICGPVELPAWP